MKKTKKCEVCGRELPLSDFSKSYRNRCRECVAAQVRSERKQKRNEGHSDMVRAIDWEQRRYEIAKAALSGILSNETATKMACDFMRNEHNRRVLVSSAISQYAVVCADALITELKERDNQQRQ